MNENEEKIYDLISSKSFAELTEDEKAVAIEKLGSEELYEKMREANLAAEEAMSDDIAPPPEMKESVMAAFDEKDEKRGIVWWKSGETSNDQRKQRAAAWWKYAAAVVLLAVGAFVFWPSGNIDRDPIAENVERKDSAAEKKLSPPKEEEIKPVEKEEVAEIKNEAQIQTPEPTALSKAPEVSEKVTIENIETTPVQEDLSEEMIAFAEDDSESDDAMLAEETMDEPMADYDGINTPEDEEVKAPSLANNAVAYDSAPASKNRSSNQKLSLESTQTGTSMGTPFNADGISLKDIGGYSKKSYVAY